MDNNSFLKINICLTGLDKALLNEYQGKKYLCCEAHALKNGTDAYGNTHTISVRTKNSDGSFNTVYIGKGKLATFGKPAGTTAPVAQASRGNNPAPIPPPAQELPAENPADDLPFK